MVISNRVLLVKSLLRMVLCLLVVCQNSGGAEEPSPPARLQGTFIQLLNVHGEWADENWCELFGYFRQLRLSQLVVQWTVYEETAFYPSQDFKTVANPPLETILHLADGAGMKVLVGLAYDPKFWERIRRHPALVEVYLRRLQFRSKSVASQLTPVVRKHPSFQGWYITEEVDDTNWVEPEARDILFQYLRGITSHLHEITPGTKVALSCFLNGHCDPRAFEEFWKALLGSASVDVVLFQDGIGAGKLEFEYLHLYLAAMRKATEAHSRELQVVVEIFRQVGGAPFNDERFKVVPTTLERVNRQVELAARYSSSPLIAFSIPEYMTPIGGQEAQRLFQSYMGEPVPER